MLLPIKSKNPPESLPIATILLIVANLFFYAVTVGPDLIIREEVLHRHGVSLQNFNLLTCFSSMFLHGDPFHLLGNMWFLYLFGFAVEGRLRTPKFLLVYFGAGLAGDLLHTFVVGPLAPEMPSIGASGAIMGVLGAALYMFPFGRVNFFYWVGWFFHGVFTVPMWGVGLIYLGMDLLGTLLTNGAEGGVAHLAHLGGAAGGFLLTMVLRPKRDSREASDAKAMFAETNDLRVLSSADLASMAASNPNDTTLVLNWIHRNIRDGSVQPECQEAFFRLLPRMIQEEPVDSVGYALAALARTPGCVSPAILIRSASGLERGHQYATALSLYEAVLRDPASRETDIEVAMFRASLLCETMFKNYPRAVQGYQEVLRRFPMSPFADQAKLRLRSLETVRPN